MYEFLKPILLNAEGTLEIGRKVKRDEIIRAEAILGKRLPPSFVQWLLEMGDNCYLFDGNLRISPLLPDKEKGSNIVEQLGNLNSANWGLDRNLIIFGSNGSDELWAFYTGYVINGEYPIVEIGAIFSADMRDYKLWNTSFKKFITLQTMFWSRLLNPELEPIEKTELLREIQDIVEPKVDIASKDIYEESYSIQEIRESLETKFWHTRYSL